MRTTLILVFTTARNCDDLTVRITSPGIVDRTQLNTAVAAIIAAAPGVAADNAEPAALKSAKYITVNPL